jgi:hypothetical protein
MPTPTWKSWPRQSAAASPPNISTASPQRPSVPKAPARSELCCAAKDCTPRPCCLAARARGRDSPGPHAPEARPQIQARSPFRRKFKRSRRKTPASPKNCAKPLSSATFKKTGYAVGMGPPDARRDRQAMMDAVHQLAPAVGIESACEVPGVARASFYRQPAFGPALHLPRPTPARALSMEERETVRDVLHPLPGLRAGRHSGHFAR